MQSTVISAQLKAYRSCKQSGSRCNNAESASMLKPRPAQTSGGSVPPFRKHIVTACWTRSCPVPCADTFLTLAGNAMPQSSAFFLNYIIIQGFFVALFRVFFPHPGVLIAIFRICGCCSEHSSPMLKSLLTGRPTDRSACCHVVSSVFKRPHPCASRHWLVQCSPQHDCVAPHCLLRFSASVGT